MNTRTSVEEAREWIIQVLLGVVRGAPLRFAGLGLLLYRSPVELALAPLAPSSHSSALPTRSMDEAIDLLRRLADLNNPLHDGFHLVDAGRLVITHVCQFVSPPIPSKLPIALPDFPIGARHMTAILASYVPSVVLTAVLTDRNQATLIERGSIQRVDLRALQ